MSDHQETDMKHVQYRADHEKRVAYITLNRPERLNAISTRMPFELKRAVQMANDDSGVAVIVVSGAGRAFCAGYDLIDYAESERGHPCSQKMPWDPYVDYAVMGKFTECYMSLWHSHKPTIAKVHGFAVAGGSDIALCCDIVVMAEEAKIGYPPARVWGEPTTAMWSLRVGPEKAKYMLFTGDLVDGREAVQMGLVHKAVPAKNLDDAVESLAKRISMVPINQLFFHKQVVNQSAEAQGLRATQRLATLFDGMTRHSPEGIAFQQRARAKGFKTAVKERDSGAPTAWSRMTPQIDEMDPHLRARL